ncbi:MAG TPA: polyribonucleotide nucleotidyltransferase, partial [Kiritimatiellia bacterium]|nr:polyribonucleotide nucleotidyltransferase [Kiritimatiellia bacterium]
MNDTTSVSINVGGAQMTIETGLLARQAAGATVCRLGDSLVFSAVTNTDKPREGIDFFPLQVEYREKYYAAGRFPGGFFKRESRPSEKEILTARIIDRPIRPLFPDGYINDVQVNNMVLSADCVNDTDVLAVNASSAALHISDVPFMGPIGCVRVGRINGEFVINPTHAQRKESDLDLIYAGTRERFLMMEGGAAEISEEDFLAAMKRGHEEIVKIVDAQHELRKMLGKAPKIVEDKAPNAEKMAFLYENGGEALRKALLIADKLERQNAVKAIKDDLQAKTIAKWPEEVTAASFVTLFDTMEIDTVRKNILEDGKRIDGRGAEDIRKLYAQIGVMPRAHGSAIFERGETSALGSITLGTKKDAQELDAITGGET